jgi:LysM repeat protein
LYPAAGVLSIPPMRNILSSLAFSLTIASVLIFAGCDERQSMKVTQDRGGHAFVPEGATSGVKNNIPVAAEGEIYITTGPKDTLTSVAKKYNTTLAWLIKRNELKDPEKTKDGLPPGTNLIVPDPNIRR